MLEVSVVRYDAKPWTLNSERRMHHMARAELAREWRFAFCMLAKQHRLPKYGDQPVIAIVQPHIAKGPMFDCDACHPAAKAAIDGLVDAEVIPSDGPEHLVEIRYLRPIRDSRDGLTVLLWPRAAVDQSVLSAIQAEQDGATIYLHPALHPSQTPQINKEEHETME